MYEVELKVRADHDRVRARLGDLDVIHLGRVRQEDVYYDAPHREFAETDEALRLRIEDELDRESVAKLTYKGPLVDDHSKTREEAETVVDDAEATRTLLDGLGFEPAATVAKDRDRYRHGEYLVVLDAVDDLGEFVEVETDVEDDLETAREGAVEVLNRLGLDVDDQIRTSYLGLLLEGDTQE